MADPQDEWIATPSVQPQTDSEWTAEPLPPSVRARNDSPWKGVSAAIGGLLTVLGLLFVGVFLIGRASHLDVYDPSEAAKVAFLPSPSQSSGSLTHVTKPPPPAAPSKPKESPEAATHWVSAPASGRPQVDLILASGPLPSTVKLGNSITIDLEATCLATGNEKPGARDGRTRGGISVSVDGDATLSSPSSGADHYSIGSLITLHDKGPVWISNQHARNELIEKVANPWRKGRVLSLRVVVTPNKPGQLTLFARSTATLRKRPVSSTENLSELDQQRLPVRAFHLTVTE